ncbi:constitutive coactivator of peroxisome proliferator-activated receptor gamma-like [Thrips palmi]|uniref:Constitutive coactivator of peroxisome proliferator-activated receptor gamma-like n=1 Tax=Thrips palmi TaxID=161013 RepID=A0A6P8ZMP9_THRPL|nr:constitutive coactivator of peroxisome proliferator-activated receptor gamma-like [Thrips palmi]
MGIQGFETYLLNSHKPACPRVLIKDLVSEYRVDTGAEAAVAILDTNILIRQCLDDLDVVAGGQFREYKANLLRYVKRLTDLGVSPVFFLDGHVEEGKMRCWRDRKGEMYNRIRAIYERVEEGGNCSPVENASAVLPAGLYECTILTLKEAGFPVFCAIAECDLEMARYAREKRCFAILSRDTDFVILQGARYYLSLFYKHFDRRSMSTILFDRAAIAKAVGLHPEHLPLLASLIQNDYVDCSYLTPLYSKMLGRPTEELQPEQRYRLEDLVPRLVWFIRKELWKEGDPVETILSRTFNGYPPFLLRRLAQKMGLRDQLELREKLRQQLEVSLSMHEYVPPNDQPARTSPEPQPELDVDLEVLDEAKSRHRSTTFLHSAVLSLLTARILQMGPALEDPRLPASCSCEAALRPFRRRVYGLLQVPGPFKEWVVPAKPPREGQPLEPCMVEPISPDPSVVPHPGLLALWRCQDDDDVAADRWRLWAWALAAHRPESAPVDVLVEELRGLPEDLVFPVSILYLLFHSGALGGCARPAVELVRLLARACLAAPLLDEEKLDALRVDRYDRLEVHVAALFMRASTYVSLLNDVLGAPVPIAKLHPELFFNGKVFHYVFTEQTLDQLAALDGTMEEDIVRTACKEKEELHLEE